MFDLLSGWAEMANKHQPGWSAAEYGAMSLPGCGPSDLHPGYIRIRAERTRTRALTLRLERKPRIKIRKETG